MDEKKLTHKSNNNFFFFLAQRNSIFETHRSEAQIKQLKARVVNYELAVKLQAELWLQHNVSARKKTSLSTDRQTIDIYVEDDFGQVQQRTFNFNDEKVEKEW